MRGHTSRRTPPPQHRIALLAYKPHPTPDDAIGAGYAWVFLLSDYAA
nr:hypothetical protein [uncultured Campylobacter sp.]